MARLPQGILGGISGKVGNVIGSSWKGIAVVKSRPLSVANPRTSGQIAQRSKMSNTVAFSKLILAGAIKPLWDRFAQQASGYNDFVSENISLFEGAYPVPANSLVISKGQMVSVTPAYNGGDSSGNELSIEYPTTLPDSLSLATDEAYIVVINNTKEEVGVSSADATRADGKTTVFMPTAFQTDDVLDVYLAFRRVDGTVVSNTGYVRADA